jgi:hypothetical protein
VDQVMKESGCLSPKKVAYCQAVRLLEEKFDGLELVHIPRCFNKAADQLAKMGSQCQPIPGGIFVGDQYCGVCGHHATPRTLFRNAFCQGFYWPTAVADAD